MDTTKGELSFALNNVNLGVAFDGIPLDKPLVPCVLLSGTGDSVELDTTEVKETKSEQFPFLFLQTSQQRALHGIQSHFHGTLLKEHHSIRLKWMETSSGTLQQQTHSQKLGFFQTQNTASECMLFVEMKLVNGVRL